MLSIGIHIEDKALNAVALSHQNHKLNLEDCFSVPFTAPQTEEAARHLELAQALKQIQEKYKNQTVRLCFVLPQNTLSCFTSSFPFSEKFKILKTLPFEIEENTLFHPNNVFFDGRISAFEKSGSSQVISFVALKENVNQFLIPLKQLKMEPYLLSAEGSALANLVEKRETALKIPGTKSPSRIYIYLGFNSSLALFFKRGSLKNVFHFKWNYKTILNEMEKKYKLTYAEAQEQFIERAFVLTEKKGFVKEQVFFSDLIQKHLKPLIQELEIHKLAVESKEIESFQEVFLMGPGAIIRNLPVFLSLKLSLPVSRIKPMESFPPSYKEEPSALIALGVAMEGLKQPPYTGLNLIRSLQKSKNRFFGARWLTLALVFAGLTVYSFVRNQGAKDLADKTHEVFAGYGKRIAFISENKINKDRIRSFLDKREKSSGNREQIKETLFRPGPMDHLKTLTAQLKDISNKGELKITHLEIDERKVQIKGFIHRDFSSQFKLKLSGLGETHSLKDLSVQMANTPNSLSGKSDVPKRGQEIQSPATSSVSQVPSSGETAKSVPPLKIGEKEVLLDDKIDTVKDAKAQFKVQLDKNKDSSEKELVSNKEQIEEEDPQKIPFFYSFTLKQVL